ncbi:methyl-accepting chemotaxis protein [Alginatibacterium sediminis]|uniref:Methyl-accepting chemotaxis protein n=1 Tax=Alginatibacterium sediminis TaxID=2164068 RepID=A0A420EI69_9ALTE|nr:HAMP domain-containing methyl-accepting chemotaxis protein [Alginatibacterium sediminis]RKF20412.1 methyl-accepting chemotaxis protein [Alginatibacterium sediminis]
MDLTRLKIRHKVELIAAIAVIGFVVFLVDSISVQRLTQSSVIEIRDNFFPALDASIQARNSLENLDQSLQTAVTTGDEESFEIAQQHIDSLELSIDKLQAAAPDLNKEISKIRTDLRQYESEAVSIAKSIVDGSADFATLPARAKRSADILEGLLKGLDDVINVSESDFNSTIDTMITTSKDSIRNGIILGVGTILVLIVVGIIVVRSIVKSINQVTYSLREIAEGEGDLTVRVDYAGRDEIADLVHWFNQFISKMQISIATTSETVASLEDVSNRLMDSSQQTSQSIQAQNALVESVSSAIHVMTDSVHMIAGNAAQASTEASSANETAQRGNQVVENTMTAISSLADEVNNTAQVINQLESYTSNAGAILDSIRGIAEQTNLLALNAAIEAARAGEQGRGFAVVADEVRTLASRTQDSTQEIQQVLEELQKGTGSAVEAMNRGTESAQASVAQSAEAGQSLTAITMKVESIFAVNEQIAQATEQQTETSDLIRTNVSEIEQISQTVAQSSTELDTVSEDIRRVTAALSDVIRQYKV